MKPCERFSEQTRSKRPQNTPDRPEVICGKVKALLYYTEQYPKLRKYYEALFYQLAEKRVTQLQIYADRPGWEKK